MARFATSTVTACIRVGFLVLACASAAPTAGQPVEPGLRDAALAGAGPALVPAVWLATNPARTAALPSWRIEAFASQGFGLDALRLLALAAAGPVGGTALGTELRQFGFTHYREVDGRLGLARRTYVGVPAGIGSAVHVGLTRITGLPTRRAIGGSVGAWIRVHPGVDLGGYLRRKADRFGVSERFSGALGLGIRLRPDARLFLGASPLESASPRLATGLIWRPVPALTLSTGWRTDPSALTIGAIISSGTGTDSPRGTIFGGAIGQTHRILGWTPAVGLGWIAGPGEPARTSRVTTGALEPPSGNPPAPRDTLAEELIEALQTDPEIYGGAAFEAALAHLRRLREEPVLVNAADVRALSRVPGLDPVLAARIVRFRRSYGPFATLEELLAVRGMSPGRYRSARSYLRLDPAEYPAVPGNEDRIQPEDRRNRRTAPTQRAVRTTLMHRTDRRLDLGRGYRTDPSEGGYLGSPYRYVTRLRVDVPGADRAPRTSRSPLIPRLVRLGATTEKDPGEPMRWLPADRQFGYDHVSAYLSFTGGGFGRGAGEKTDAAAGSMRSVPGPVYRLILGDYRLKAGQGLLFGGGYSPGKSGQLGSSPLGIRSGPSEYGSTAENGFYRGATLRLDPTRSVRTWTFFSRRSHDGVLEKVAGYPDSVRTLRGSGLHRTLTEIGPRRALRETAYGGALAWMTDTGGLEITGYRSHFEPPLAEPHRLDRPEPFRGDSWAAASLAGRLSLGSTYLYGELARGGRGGLAGLGGLQAGVTEHADLVLHLRHYPRSFWSPHGGAFAEQSGPPENEVGLFAGLRLRPSDRWRLRIYTDQFQFPGPRYGVPRATSGHEEFVRADYEWGRDRALHVQFRSKSRESGRSVETEMGPVRTVGPEHRETGRIQVTVPLHDRVRLRIRGSGVRARPPIDLVHAPPSPRSRTADIREHSSTHTRERWGFGTFTDLRFRPVRSLRIDARATWFRTDGYGSRIYQLENDLYYAFSVPVLFGVGHRAYLLTAWSPLRGLTLEAKYAVTVVRDRPRLGSGREKLEGNRRREVRFQIRWTGRW